jgi:hypothetical protein
MAAVLKKTTSSSLQLQLEAWVALVDTAISHTNPSLERSDAILAFCRVFVPADVSEDDIDHFSGMLTTDEVIESLSIQKTMLATMSKINLDTFNIRALYIQSCSHYVPVP